MQEKFLKHLHLNIVISVLYVVVKSEICCSLLNSCLRIDANKMSYTGSTGDVYAQGDVVVSQGNQTLMAPRIEGNTKTTEYRTVGGYRYLEDGG